MEAGLKPRSTPVDFASKQQWRSSGQGERCRSVAPSKPSLYLYIDPRKRHCGPQRPSYRRTSASRSIILHQSVVSAGTRLEWFQRSDQINDACISEAFGFLTKCSTKVSTESLPGPKIRMSRAAKRNV